MRGQHTIKEGYQIECDNSIPFLRNNIGTGAIITSLPDAHELQMKTSIWINWFIHAAKLCIEFVPYGLPVIFFQTDRRNGGKTISKFDLCMKASEGTTKDLVFHKIVLRKEPGKIDLYRPTFSHLFCFGDGLVKVGKISADVIANGELLWSYGMGMNATLVACEFAKRFSNNVYDPFCGMGTVLKVASNLGMNSFGIEIDHQRAEDARRMLANV